MTRRKRCQTFKLEAIRGVGGKASSGAVFMEIVARDQFLERVQSWQKQRIGNHAQLAPNLFMSWAKRPKYERKRWEPDCMSACDAQICGSKRRRISVSSYGKKLWNPSLGRPTQSKSNHPCCKLLQPAFLMNWLECRRSKTAICHEYIAKEWIGKNITEEIERIIAGWYKNIATAVCQLYNLAVKIARRTRVLSWRS